MVNTFTHLLQFGEGNLEKYSPLVTVSMWLKEIVAEKKRVRLKKVFSSYSNQ